MNGNSATSACKSGVASDGSLFQKKVASPPLSRSRSDMPTHTRNQDVILEIASHAWKMLRYLDAGSGQLPRVADTRLHQHLGCVDGAERTHRLAASRDPTDCALVEELHPHRTIALEHDARHQSRGDSRRPLRMRGLNRAPPPAPSII
jgi:hypothetical protein